MPEVVPVDRSHEVDWLLSCSEGGHGGHAHLLELDARSYLFDMELEPPLVIAPDSGSSWKISGPGPSLQGCRLRLDLLNFSQFSAQLCFAFLVQVLPLGVGSCEDPIEPQRGEFTFTSHLLGLQPGLHEPQPQAPLTPRMYSFLLLTHHSWHFLDPHTVLIV